MAVIIIIVVEIEWYRIRRCKKDIIIVKELVIRRNKIIANLTELESLTLIRVLTIKWCSITLIIIIASYSTNLAKKSSLSVRLE